MPVSLRPVTLTLAGSAPDELLKGVEVQFRLSRSVIANGVEVTTAPMIRTTNASGVVTENLLPYNDPGVSPQGVGYFVSYKADGRFKPIGYFLIPTGATLLDLTTLVPASPTIMSGIYMTEPAADAKYATIAQATSKIPLSQKGEPEGVATLDVDGKVPPSQLAGAAVSDATASVKGIVQLAGVRTGTAAAPSLAAGSVGTSFLADTAVTTGKLADGSVTQAKLGTGSVTGTALSSTVKDAAANVASARTLGTGALQAAAGNDSRLSDTRVPTDGSVTLAKLVSGFPLMGAVLRPIGAVDDAARINAALAANPCVILHGGDLYAGQFDIKSALVMPSNRTLILMDAEVRRRSDGAAASSTDSRILVNANQNSTGDSNIFVHGVGRAVFNGMASEHTRNTTSLRFNHGISLVNVTNYQFTNITIGPTNGFAALQQKCTFGKWTNIHLAQDVTTPNQDGIDFGPGCSDIVVNGVTGKTGDDLFSIFAQNTSASIDPYISGLTAAERNIANLYFHNIDVDVAINVWRINHGDGSTIDKIVATDVVNRNLTSQYAVVNVGSTNYVTTTGVKANCKRFSLKGFWGGGRYLLNTENNFQQFEFSDISIVSAWLGIIANFNTVTSFVPDFADVTIDGLRTVNSVSFGMVMATKTGVTAANIVLRNFHIAKASGVLNNSGTVTNLVLQNLHFDALSATPFVSAVAETGDWDGVSAGSTSGVSNRYTGAAVKAKLGPKMFYLRSGDTVPAKTVTSVATTQGSMSLDGTTRTFGASWIADGTTWLKIIDLPAFT